MKYFISALLEVTDTASLIWTAVISVVGGLFVTVIGGLILHAILTYSSRAKNAQEADEEAAMTMAQEKRVLYKVPYLSVINSKKPAKKLTKEQIIKRLLLTIGIAGLTFCALLIVLNGVYACNVPAGSPTFVVTIILLCLILLLAVLYFGLYKKFKIEDGFLKNFDIFTDNFLDKPVISIICLVSSILTVISLLVFDSCASAKDNNVFNIINIIIQSIALIGFFIVDVICIGRKKYLAVIMFLLLKLSIFAIGFGILNLCISPDGHDEEFLYFWLSYILWGSNLASFSYCLSYISVMCFIFVLPFEKLINFIKSKRK